MYIADDEDWVFMFGKHRGRRLVDVLDVDPQYLCWANDSGTLHMPSDIIAEAVEEACYISVPEWCDATAADIY